MSNHEDKKRPEERVDPFLMLSIRNEVRTEIERAVDRLEKSVDRIETRLLKVESRTSYILGLLSVIGIVGGILLFFLRAGGGG